MAPLLDFRGLVEIGFRGDNVRRQHPVGFHQADGQGNGDHQRHHHHKLAHNAGHQHQRQEGGHGGQHRRGYRGGDFLYRLDTGGHPVGATRQALVDGLDHDHGIIHQHTQRNHHAQQHHNVQAEAGDMQYPEGTGENKGNADAGKKGDTKTEKQPGDQQHEKQADQGIGLHDINGLIGNLGRIIDQYQLHPGLLGVPVAIVDKGFQVFDQLQGIGFGLLGNGEKNAGLVVVADQALCLFTPALYSGNLT